MKIKHIVIVLALAFALVSCVGQKEDAPDVPKEKEEEEKPEPQEEAKSFLKRVLAVEFTATWCVYCPDMKESIQKVKDIRPDRIIEMSVHYADGYDCPAGDSLTNLHSVTMWPTTVFDNNSKLKTSSLFTAVLTAMVDTSLSQAPAVCGIKAKSSLTGNKLNVTVYATSPEDGDYFLQAAVVEDNIPATQTGRGEGYLLQGVLRAIPLTVNLKLKNKTESSVSFEYFIPEGNSAENTGVIIYIMKSDIINNVIEIDAGNDIGYEYDSNTQ